MIICQYTCGRGENKGYNSSANSEGAALLVEEWMHERTRASLEDNELPTMEIQSCAATPGKTAKLVICASRHVQYNYGLVDGTVQRTSRTRPYDYSHYLILPAEDNGASPESRLKTALELLMYSDLYLDPYSFQQAVSTDHEYLQTLDIDEKSIQAIWKRVEAAPREQTLTGLNLAAFLARFWEACWNRKNGRENENPLILITTEPNRNRETGGVTVIEDGVRFFHDDVLPFLPAAITNMFSVSLGCIGEATRAQEGTACMVCYPSASTVNRIQVYRAYANTVSDDAVDANYLYLGEAMLKRQMPQSYQILCGLGRHELAEQDFDFAYLLAEYEGMLNDLQKPLSQDELHLLFMDCANGLPRLADILRQDGLADREIYQVLFPLELRLAQAAVQYPQVYSSDLYIKWLEFDKGAPQRLNEENLFKAQEAWKSALVRPYENVDWDLSMPLILLIDYPAGQRRTALIQAVLENKQFFDRPISHIDNLVFAQLLGIQQRSRIEEENQLADQLLTFLISHCQPNEEMLSPMAYLKALPPQPLSSTVRENMIGDLCKLIMRHLSATEANAILDVKDTLDEYDYQELLSNDAQKSSLRLTLEEMTLLLADAEIRLPDWCNQNQHNFHQKLYAAMLDRAISLKSRNALLTGEKLSALQKSYDQCLTGFYRDCGQNNSPLAEIIKRDWKDTVPWERQVVVHAREAKGIPCDTDSLLDRLILLRQQEEKETAEAYLKLLEEKYSENPELLHRFIEKTLALRVDSSEQWVSQDALTLMNVASKDPDHPCVKDIRLFSEWFVRQNGKTNPVLSQKKELVFLDALKNALDNNADLAQLTSMYCNTTSPKDERETPFVQQLFQEFHGKQLEELSRPVTALEGVRILSAQSPFYAQKAKEILVQSTENSKESGLEPEDALFAIQFAEAVQLKKIGNEVSQILRSVSVKSLPENVVSRLAAYAERQPECRESLASVLLERACDTKHIYRAKSITDLMLFLNKSGTKTERKEECLRLVIQNILEEPNDLELTESLLASIIPIAREAKELNPRRVKTLMMKLYELTDPDQPMKRFSSGNAGTELTQMDTVTKELGITLDLCSADTPQWIHYFFQHDVNALCEKIREDAPTVNKMIHLAKENDAVSKMNHLWSMTYYQPLRERMAQKLSAACRQVVEKDATLLETNELSNVISQVNSMSAADENDLFSRCLVKEVIDHVGHLFHDEARFRSLLKNEKSVRYVKRCFESLNMEDYPELRVKENAINNACSVMEFEGFLAGCAQTPGHEMHALIQGLDLSGWDYVRDVVAQYGHERLKNSKLEAQLFPFLLDAQETSNIGVRTQWKVFLTNAFPLEDKGGWMKTNIWKSTENTYGKVAFILNWLSHPGLETEKQSFTDFLNASDIGRTAKNSRRIQTIQKHLKSIGSTAQNAMIDWLIS